MRFSGLQRMDVRNRRSLSYGRAPQTRWRTALLAASPMFGLPASRRGAFRVRSIRFSDGNFASLLSTTAHSATPLHYSGFHFVSGKSVSVWFVAAHRGLTNDAGAGTPTSSAQRPAGLSSRRVCPVDRRWRGDRLELDGGCGYCRFESECCTHTCHIQFTKCPVQQCFWWSTGG